MGRSPFFCVSLLIPRVLLISERRISRLHVWWIKIGITPELIKLSSPQQNGRHERFHHTLKQDTTRPPASNHPSQQLASIVSERSTTSSVPMKLSIRKPPLLVITLQLDPIPVASPDRVPGSFRSSQCQPQWQHPLGLRLGQCNQGPHGRVHRPRRSRCWYRVRLLRTGFARPF